MNEPQLKPNKMNEFQQKVQQQFDRMCKTGKLFRSSMTGQDVWYLYISTFIKQGDPVFRNPESSIHNCNLCNNFIRRYGNIVAIDENYNIMTIWDVDAEGEYHEVAKEISSALQNSLIGDVFVETFNELNSLPYESCTKTSTQFQLGVNKNVKRYTKEEAELFGVVEPNELRTFNHLYITIPSQFIDKSGDSAESIIAGYRDNKNVFARTMTEIPSDTLNLVKDLILQGSLLNGDAHIHKVESILNLKKEYDSPEMWSALRRDNWFWINSYQYQYAKFKNELIGVLCSDLAEGLELNKACQDWNKRVDPANYMKAIAPITKKQIEEAQRFVEENGYVESFDRRFATMDDIKVSEILHSNVGDGTIKNVSIFDAVKSTSTRHKKSEFDGIEEVTIDRFMKDILPTCTSVEALLTNSLENNLMSLTTANIQDSKPIFKWSNNYSWTFNGNLAGKSEIKERVKSAGGKVDGVLRFSIMWSGDGVDNSDLDAHCIEPNKFRIYYGNKLSPYTEGNLDIDITQPLTQMPKGAVENITYPSLNPMIDGTYIFLIHQFSARSSKGFKAEIEFDGELYSYESNKPVRGDVVIAEITLKKGEFTIKHVHPLSSGTGTSKKIYNLQTNEFHKVNLICLSPNHWDGNKAGNKHYLFMLENCKAPLAVTSFHAENLIPELAEHRKVLEVLSNTTKIEPSDAKQLSGLGFNATVRNELIVKLQGTHKRILRVKF